LLLSGQNCSPNDRRADRNRWMCVTFQRRIIYFFALLTFRCCRRFMLFCSFPRPSLRRPNWASIPPRSPRHLLTDSVKIIQIQLTSFPPQHISDWNDSVSHFPMAWTTNRRRRCNCRWRWQMSRIYEFLSFFSIFFLPLAAILSESRKVLKVLLSASINVPQPISFFHSRPVAGWGLLFCSLASSNKAAITVLR
jgi:hypothetical protein